MVISPKRLMPLISFALGSKSLLPPIIVSFHASAPPTAPTAVLTNAVVAKRVLSLFEACVTAVVPVGKDGVPVKA